MDSPNRNRNMATAFAAVVLGMGAFGASAQSVPADAQTPVQTAPADAAAQSDALATQDAAANRRASNVGCVKDTGTNIRPRDPKTGKALCIGPGRSYSREQIDRTGQADIADALRRLDPSIH